jgi:catechol 2,3-dioxygenase-like lactoylglutathione lyase family enzyme
MPNITKVGRVLLPVSDQEAAIRFYTNTLGFALAVDVPFGQGGLGRGHPARRRDPLMMIQPQ